MKKLGRCIPFALAVLSLNLAAHAPAALAGQSPHPLLTTPRVHPEAIALFSYRARTGRTFPPFRANEEFERTGRLPVVIRFLAPPSDQAVTRLETSGVRFERREPIASGAWLAIVTEEGLAQLGSDPDVAAVSVDLHRDSPRPDDAAADETAADETATDETAADETTATIARRASMAKDGRPLDGEGIVIADIDSPVYIHHPAFFRADGPVFAWVDVDGDERLTPGVDGVDLDGNGSIEPAEVLHALRSSVVVQSRAIDTHTEFEPDIDYLYLDQNGNGERDYGPEFGEATPAYGEPLFVFDDANHDHKTQRSERILQLKTSKFKAIAAQGKTFTRGASGPSGLVMYSPSSDPLNGWHAMGVAGILVGGQAGISRWLGIAPAADLLLSEDHSLRRGQVAAVQWAIDGKANIILTEYALWAGLSLDGSSEGERILDAANDKGIVTVSPAGNLAGSKKHRTLKLLPGEQKVALRADAPMKYVMLNIHYRGAERAIGLTLEAPDKRRIEIPESAPEGIELSDGTNVHALARTSSRGTHERFLYWMAAENGPMLPNGSYELTVNLEPGASLEVDAYTFNSGASWLGGFTFNEDSPTRTLCNPATSDKTITVGAYVLHDDPNFFPFGEKGELTEYSSRGPRVDGTGGVDLIAPANPLSAASPSDAAKGDVVWTPFSGTSGAGPHVAAAAALLMQAHPDEGIAKIKERLFSGARPMRPMKGGEATVGKGKLDIARALGVTVPSGGVPRASVEVGDPTTTDAEVRLRLEVKDDEPVSDLLARWDLDYDGHFDTEWLPVGEQLVPPVDPTLGLRRGVKVEVRDRQGHVNGATTELAARPADDESAVPNAVPTVVDPTGCTCHVVRAPADRPPWPAVVGLALASALAGRRGRKRPAA